MRGLVYILLGAFLTLGACTSSVTMQNSAGDRLECSYRPSRGMTNAELFGNEIFGPVGGGPSPREEIQNCVDAAEVRGYHRVN